MNPMRVAFSLGVVAVLGGCAASVPDGGQNRLLPTTASAGGGGGTNSATLDAGFANFVNPEGGLLHIAQDTAGAGAAARGGSAGAADVPAGCEVGKFCAPMTPDPTNCGTLTLKQDVEVTRTPGNLLVLFDQSLSMTEAWGMSGQNKLQAAQAAIANAVMALQDSLTVGALFFPTYDCVPGLPPPKGGAVNPLDGPGQIPFQPGPQFLTAWTQHWSAAALGLGIGTPMQEAFDRADVAIQKAQLKGALIVLAVTDGQPNCIPDPTITMIPTATETQHAADWLSTKMIKSYVVGLPGAMGVQLLNDVAMSGGTMQYLLPDDPKTLEAKLKEVVSETVKTSFNTCSIKLTPAANPPDKLQMLVVEAANGHKSRVDHMLGPDAGWTISSDGMQVEITGQLCNDAKSGRFSSISFEYGCPNVEPPPPLPPPMLQ
jgi:hypothetical protein